MYKTHDGMTRRTEVERFIQVLHGDDRDSFIFVGTKNGEKFTETKVSKAELVDTICSLSAENTYVSINGFARLRGGRGKDNLRQLNGIFIDIDAHDLEGEALVSAVTECQMVLDEGIVFSLLPCPTMIISSGRGIHLYYVYEHSIPVRLRSGASNSTGIYCHRRLTELLYDRVSSMVEDTELSVDKACADTSRYVRVPGTYNAKAGTMCSIITSDGPLYQFENLFEALN